MTFTLKHQQIRILYRLIKLKTNFNITANYDSFRRISYSKVYHVKRKENKNIEILNEFFSQEKNNYEDTFGNIENYEIKYERLKDDPEDIEEYKKQRAAKGKTILEYKNEIQNYLKNKNYDKALEVLEVDMVNDKIPTQTYIYKILIAYNGDIGNIEEAYRLYLRYKKRQGKTNGGIITSLFNACANCKNSFLALEKANAIRESLDRDKNYVINTTNYNAMLKAYGRHGDLQTSLKIVDEVLAKKDKVKIDTFGFLLQACASDTNSGLRHALIVWRNMIQNTLNPRIYEFNVMLRCVRDCFLGEPELFKDFIKQIENRSDKFFKRKAVIKYVNNEKKRITFKIHLDKDKIQKTMSNTTEKNIKELESPETKNQNSILTLEESEALNQTEDLNENQGDSKEVDEYKEEILVKDDLKKAVNLNAEVPNLIALIPSLGSCIDFNNITKPYEKLLLLGGIKGFLKVMSEFNTKPDIKTFTLMLQIIPSTTEDEENLMKIMDVYKVKRDSGFYNNLIKRRCFRNEISSMQDTLLLMQKESIAPDIITFGVIALGCNTLEKATELINSAHNFGYRLNTEILETLLNKALIIEDWSYVKTILATAKEDEVELSPRFTALLSRGIAREKLQRKKKCEELTDVIEN